MSKLDVPPPHIFAREEELGIWPLFHGRRVYLNKRLERVHVVGDAAKSTHGLLYMKKVFARACAIVSDFKRSAVADATAAD